MVDKVYPSTPVHCRVCKKAIDRNAETDWVMASRNYYFHNDCYEKWKHSTNIDDDQYWIELIYDFIKRDLKVEYNYFMCENQRLKYVQKNGFTNRGIYFTLKYFYEVKNGDWSKGHGGLGIIPYVYKDAAQYWSQHEDQQKDILEKIVAQAEERGKREKIKIERKQKEMPKPKYNLDDLGEDED